MGHAWTSHGRNLVKMHVRALDRVREGTWPAWLLTAQIPARHALGVGCAGEAQHEKVPGPLPCPPWYANGHAVGHITPRVPRGVVVMSGKRASNGTQHDPAAGVPKELLVVWELPRQDVGVEEGHWGSNIAGTGAGRAGVDTARTCTRRRDLKGEKRKKRIW